MATRRNGTSPSSLILTGLGLSIAAGVLIATNSTASFLGVLIALPAAVCMLVGCVGEGVRIGMNAHRVDRLLEKYSDEG